MLLSVPLTTRLQTGGTFANEPAVAADLNETSLEDALISIAGFTDERGLIIALKGMKLIIPRQLQFVAERLMVSNLRVGTADNDIKRIKLNGHASRRLCSQRLPN